jgi:ferredoxin-NADP reductase
MLSVVMRLGGDQELPEMPLAINRKAMVVADRRLVARDADVVQLTLTAPDGTKLREWHAGAHIDLHLPSGRMRQYSLCGDPRQEREYRIAVRRIPRGGGGSVEVHGLAIGQMVEISEPRNAFLMPLPGSGSQAEKLRFIAGGIGITPILPMARLAERLGVPWSLCYTGRHRDSLPFLDELLAFGEKVRVRTDDEHGLPTAAELLDGVDRRTAVYVCGPPPMIEAVRRSIPLAWGTELHVERFSPLPVVDGTPFELELARSGELVEVRGNQSALAALRAARPNVSYSCQQGFCGTCVQRVVAGDVEHRDNTLTDRQRELGQMLVCVSRAKSKGGRLVLDL